MVIWKLYKVERLTTDYASSYIGHSLPNIVYDSGADLRRLGQVFTSTDEGSPTTVYNKQLQAVLQGY